MRLVDLHPEYWAVYIDQDKTPDKGGIPTGEIDLAFDCPACGGPHRILVRLGPSRQEPKDNAGHCRRWAWSEPRGDKHMLVWLAGITIAPSIDNTTAGHGPKHPQCSFHGTVAKGEIAFS